MKSECYYNLVVPPHFNNIIKYCWCQIYNNVGVQYHIELLKIIIDSTANDLNKQFYSEDFCLFKYFMRRAVRKWIEMKNLDLNNFSRKEVWVRIDQYDIETQGDFIPYFERVLRNLNNCCLNMLASFER